MRLAALDIGTNSTRLLVADVARGRVVHEHTRRMVITRLGRGVDRTRRFDPAALARTLDTVEEYARVCTSLGVDAVRVVATSATRDASNQSELLDGIHTLFGVVPEVLSGTEEAAASFLGAVYDLPAAQNGAPVLVFDIGGGSTEFVVGALLSQSDDSLPPAVSFDAVSVDVGNVRLTERHISTDPPRPSELAAVRDDVHANWPLVRALLKRTGAAEVLASWAPERVVGVAGTVNTVAGLAYGLDGYDPERLHQAVLTRTQIAGTVARLHRMTTPERAALPVMPPGREDVISAGGAILEAVCDALGISGITVSETDILDGVLLGLAARRRR